MKKRLLKYLSIMATVLLLYPSMALAAPISNQDRKALNLDSVHHVYDYQESCAGNGSLSTVSLSAKENKTNALSYFIQRGLTPEQSAGIVGNLMAESGVNPKRVQGTSTPSGDKDTLVVDDKTGYGIAQWTSRGRQQGLVNFSKARGLAIQGDLLLQLDYLWQELNSGYKSSLNKIKQAPNLRAASDVFMIEVESPADQSASAKAERAGFGQQILNLFGSAAMAGAPINQQAASCQTSTGGVLANFVGFPLSTTKADMTQRNGGQFANGRMAEGGHLYAAHDIMAATGTPVVSIMKGVVVKIGEDKCPGRYIAVYNRDINITISYLHLDKSRTLVKAGDAIEPGQNIGFVGTNGEGCGSSHLHIDAVTGDRRIGCARESCPAANAAKFRAASDSIKLPQQLFETYNKLQ